MVLMVPVVPVVTMVPVVMPYDLLQRSHYNRHAQLEDASGAHNSFFISERKKSGTDTQVIRKATHRDDHGGRDDVMGVC